MDAQKNDAGQVALIYYQTINPVVEFGKYGTPTYRGYKFITQHNICLCWVDEADVQRILDLKGGCCGGQKRGIYRLASETQVRVWTYGGR